MAKIFLDTEDKLTSEVILGKTDEELGQIVRANDMAEQKIKSRFAMLKNLGAPTRDKSKNTVPE